MIDRGILAGWVGVGGKRVLYLRYKGMERVDGCRGHGCFFWGGGVLGFSTASLGNMLCDYDG